MNKTRDHDYEGPEEPEYHFADDQVNYEIEPDVTSSTEKSSTIKPPLFAKPSSYRRTIIGIIVFFILVFLVYKLFIPSSLVPSTEISQTTKTSLSATKTAVSSTPIATATPSSRPEPASPPVIEQETTPPPPATTQSKSVTPTTTNTTEDNAISAEITTKLATLEEQNAKLLSLFENQNSAKTLEIESDNNTTQEKIHKLNKRLDSIEASLNKMASLLKDLQGGKSSSLEEETHKIPIAKATEAKILYTVQAIIPGRAWLKSDMGDTVTVAEGDLLKGYGRVTKIDPYDGIVEINTGKKLLTLSYGAGGS